MQSLRDALGIQRGEDEPWWRQAACKGYPLETFYFELGSRRKDGSDLLESRAQRVCARCPVRRECLEDALKNETSRVRFARSSEPPDRPDRALPAGVFGGQTPEARWAPHIAHVEDCADRTCVGCRPITERLGILEQLFRARSHRFLTRLETLID